MDQIREASIFFKLKSWKQFFEKMSKKFKEGFQPKAKEILFPKSEFGMMSTPDHSYIRYAKYFYPVKEFHKGTVITLMGRREFIEEYREVNAEFIDRNYKVFTFDWRGQGGSKRTLNDPIKGHIDDYNTYLLDLKQFFNQIVLPDFEPPLYIFAHSMGGNVALRAVLEGYFPHLKALILSAPMVDVRTGPYPPKIARAIAKTMSLAGYKEKYIFGEKLTDPEFEPFEDNPFTHDVDQFSKRRKVQMDYDQYVVRGYTFGWLEATFRSIKTLHKLLKEKKVDIPMLLLSPENDPVIKQEIFQDVLKTFPEGELKIYPKTRHCLLDESKETRTIIWQDIDHFLSRVKNK